MKTYETAQGDTWDYIAVLQYGNERTIAPLLEANADYRDMVVFPSGLRLHIPELPTGYRHSATPPPWRDDE